MPRFILIRTNRFATMHARTLQTDMTDRQTDREDRQRTDSIGRTVLQTVAQKSLYLATPLAFNPDEGIPLKRSP